MCFQAPTAQPSHPAPNVPDTPARHLRPQRSEALCTCCPLALARHTCIVPVPLPTCVNPLTLQSPCSELPKAPVLAYSWLGTFSIRFLLVHQIWCAVCTSLSPSRSTLAKEATSWSECPYRPSSPGGEHATSTSDPGNRTGAQPFAAPRAAGWSVLSAHQLPPRTRRCDVGPALCRPRHAHTPRTLAGATPTCTPTCRPALPPVPGAR